MSLERWALSEGDIPQLVRLACRFHQDFDVQRLTFRQALDQHVRFLEPDERERLGEDVELALARAPSRDQFDRLLVAAGAETWPADDDPRAELADWLSREA